MNEHGELTYSKGEGTSMLPLLRQGRDEFTVRKKGSARCSKYDVVLYKKPQNRFVLHRIIEVRERDYVIMGDNCLRREYGITDDDIIGVMTGFVRNGKAHSVEEPGYRLYSRLWCAAAPLRIGFGSFKTLVRRLKNKIRRLLNEKQR